MSKEMNLKCAKSKVRRPLGSAKKPSPIIGRNMIEACVPLIAKQIKEYYIEQQVDEVVMMPILHGGLFFYGNLVPLCARQPDPKLKDPNHSRYCAKFQILDGYLDIKSQVSGGNRRDPEINAGIVHPPKRNRHFLLIDDLCETGETLESAKSYIAMKCQYTKKQSDQLIRIVSFLWKSEFPGQKLQPDWYGFRISSHYLAGYGMDGCEGKHRHLPSIYVHDNRPEFLEEESWASRFDVAMQNASPHAA